VDDGNKLWAELGDALFVGPALGRKLGLAELLGNTEGKVLGDLLGVELGCMIGI
jgi:hypothetical protein